MEHVEVINKIIEAEQQAQRIAREAAHKRESMQGDLQTARQNLRDAYFERARRRIELVRQREESLADEAIAELEAQYAKDRQAVEEEYAGHREEWVEKLVSQIVGHKV